jgi:hypothetical protein
MRRGVAVSYASSVFVVRDRRIELLLSVWKTDVLPLN